MVPSERIQQLLGVDRIDPKVPEVGLPRIDNPESKAVNALVDELRKDRVAYMKLRVAKRSDALEQLFMNMLVEDRSPAGMSYVEYLCHVHRMIQNRMDL